MLIRLSFLPVVFSFFLVGCGSGKDDKGIVKGQVTFNAEKLPQGSISFFDEKDTLLASGSITEGNYRVENLPPGPVRVAIKVLAPSTEKPPAGAPPASTPAKYVPIPERYATPGTSGLTHTVTQGEQEKNFELTGKK